MVFSRLTSPTPEDLLETLKEYQHLSPYVLTLYRTIEGGSGSGGGAASEPCGSLGGTSLCRDKCETSRQEAVRDAVESRKPLVFRCATGLLSFAVPIPVEGAGCSCLIGGGVREKTASSLSYLEALSNAETGDGEMLLDRLEELPAVTMKQIGAAAEKTFQLLPDLLKPNLFSLSLEKTTSHLKTMADVSHAIDQAENAEECLSLLSQSLVVLFDIPRLVVIQAKGTAYAVCEALGLPEPLPFVGADKVRQVVKRQKGSEPIVLREEVGELFPGTRAGHALGIPLHGDGQPLGLIVIFDCDLHPRDLVLIDLLAGRAASRLRLEQKDAAHTEASAFSEKLVSMFSVMSMIEGRDELCRNVLSMAADLVGASRGSLMLVDDAGQYLQIASARGMSESLAKSLSLKVGSGIAGRVAQSGMPLMVNDIEQDKRVRIANRPRFQTKSFVCVPLKVNDRVLGVLNLADKDGGAVFTERDLELLNTFALHAAITLKRMISLERTGHLEELSVTDPLTGLYNRRFLNKRIEEELNRSNRHGCSFTVMLIDLDHFKLYNDRCGHLAGDTALKKTAELLQKSAREMDVVARYGGEEFCLVLPATAKQESIFVGERIRRAIEREAFALEGKLPDGTLTACIGVSSFPEDGETAEDLFAAADVALYQAKGDGRNRLVIFDPARAEQKESNS